MKIISYDVGIKNLAYCICDENMKIIKWDIIDLLNVDNKCSFCDNNADLLFYKYKLCKDHKKKVEELKEPSTEKIDKDDKCTVCKKNAKCKLGNAFFCNLHRKSFETKNYKIKETNVSCDKISTAQFKYNLVTALDQLPELTEIDTVLIENQPSFKNPKSNCKSPLRTQPFKVIPVNNFGSSPVSGDEKYEVAEPCMTTGPTIWSSPSGRFIPLVYALIRSYVLLKPQQYVL